MQASITPCQALDLQGIAQQWLAHETNAPAHAFKGHGFLLETLGFLLPPALRCELVENIPICALPGTAPWLLGMTHLRGKILPVFDLKRLVFGGTTAPRYQRYLCVDVDERGFALGVGRMPFAVSLQAQHRLARIAGIPELLQAHCQAVYHHEHFWIDLDFKAFFRQHAEQLVRA